MLASAISHIDRLIKTQLLEVLKQSKLQKLFARWLALDYLITVRNGNQQIKLKLCDISWQEITREIDKHADIETTHLFKLIYSDEYDHPGGEPYGLLIGDYTFSIKDADAQKHYYLGQLAELMQVSFVPFVAAAASESFEIEDYKQLDLLQVLYQHHANNTLTSWQALRKKMAARYISLIMPSILFDNYINKKFCWRNTLVKKPNTWVNAAFTMAATVIENFNADGWFIRTTGAAENNSHGMVPGLKSSGYRGLSEILCDEQIDRAISQLGLTTFIQLPYMENAYFLHINSISLYQYPNDLSHTVPYLLCACRFAHYIKIMQRNFIGSAKPISDWQKRLENWLNQYVASNHDLPISYRGQYPLTAGKIELTTAKGSDETFLSKIYLQPFIKSTHMALGMTLTTAIKLN